MKHKAYDWLLSAYGLEGKPKSRRPSYILISIFLSLLFLLLCPLNLSSSLSEVLKNYIFYSVVELGVSGSPVFFVLASAPNSPFFI